MLTTEDELQALKEERRRSAAKVRTLLEQLEEAEREFAAITEKMKAFRNPVAGCPIPDSASSTPRV